MRKILISLIISLFVTTIAWAGFGVDQVSGPAGVDNVTSPAGVDQVEGGIPSDVTVYPTTDVGGYWTCSSGTDRWAMVDEDPPDDATTYMYRVDSNAGQNFSNLPSLPAGTILAVGIYITHHLGAGACGSRADLKVNGTHYYGDDEAASGSWTQYYYEWTVNPNTSAAWVKEDVEGTGSNPIEQWGIDAINMDASDQVDATQVWLYVRYN